ncbi:MAG: hypothetical protein ACREF9_08735, partial [Opitutaceae bacterium]
MKRTHPPALFLHILICVVAGAGWVAVSGCTQVQVAPDVRGEYEFGTLQVYVDSDFMRTYEASKRGMK